MRPIQATRAPSWGYTVNAIAGDHGEGYRDGAISRLTAEGLFYGAILHRHLLDR